MNGLVRAFRRPLKSTLLGLQRPPYASAWHIAPEELEGVEIRWPTTLEWPKAWIWAEPLYSGLKVRVPVRRYDIAQHLTGSLVIEFHRKGRMLRVCINSSDYPDLTHIDRPEAASEALDLEFKMQYRAGGYGTSKIVPGGYVSDAMLVDWYARSPRRKRDLQQFSWDVYGRFGLQFATEVRSAAINALRTQSRVRFYGGDKKVAYPEFLMEIARSRICLDLPGNGPFCFRLVNYFAVGACVVSPPHATAMHVPLVDRKHIVYTKPDMSDLVELCQQYAEDAQAREAMKEASREYYWRHLHWRSISDYYLRTMLDRLAA